MESYLQDVSTRSVKNIIEKLGVSEISASAVSTMSKKLDRKVDEFLEGRIDSGMSYLIVDATYFEVRNNCLLSQWAFLANFTPAKIAKIRKTFPEVREEAKGLDNPLGTCIWCGTQSPLKAKYCLTCRKEIKVKVTR